MKLSAILFAGAAASGNNAQHWSQDADAPFTCNSSTNQGCDSSKVCDNTEVATVEYFNNPGSVTNGRCENYNFPDVLTDESREWYGGDGHACVWWSKKTPLAHRWFEDLSFAVDGAASAGGWWMSGSVDYEIKLRTCTGSTDDSKPTDSTGCSEWHTVTKRLSNKSKSKTYTGSHFGVVAESAAYVQVSLKIDSQRRLAERATAGGQEMQFSESIKAKAWADVHRVKVHASCSTTVGRCSEEQDRCYCYDHRGKFDPLTPSYQCEARTDGIDGDHHLNGAGIQNNNDVIHDENIRADGQKGSNRNQVTRYPTPAPTNEHDSFNNMHGDDAVDKGVTNQIDAQTGINDMPTAFPTAFPTKVGHSREWAAASGTWNYCWQGPQAGCSDVCEPITERCDGDDGSANTQGGSTDGPCTPVTAADYVSTCEDVSELQACCDRNADVFQAHLDNFVDCSTVMAMSCQTGINEINMHVDVPPSQVHLFINAVCRPQADGDRRLSDTELDSMIARASASAGTEQMEFEEAFWWKAPPTRRPTSYPTRKPTKEPTKEPTTANPTRHPTAYPTSAPTPAPTKKECNRFISDRPGVEDFVINAGSTCKEGTFEKPVGWVGAGPGEQFCNIWKCEKNTRSFSKGQEVAHFKKQVRKCSVEQYGTSFCSHTTCTFQINPQSNNQHVIMVHSDHREEVGGYHKCGFAKHSTDTYSGYSDNNAMYNHLDGTERGSQRASRPACDCICFGLNDKTTDVYGKPNVPLALRRSAKVRQAEEGFERTLNEISSAVQQVFGWTILKEQRKERSCTSKAMFWTGDWKCKDPVDKNNDYFYYQGYYAGMSTYRSCPWKGSWYSTWTYVRRAYKQEYCTRLGPKDWQDTDWNGEKHDTCHVQISDDGQCISDGDDWYKNNEKCVFEFNGPGVLEVEKFDLSTTRDWSSDLPDFLQMNGKKVTGRDANSMTKYLADNNMQHLSGKTEFTFLSNDYYYRPGFKFCVRADRTVPADLDRTTDGSGFDADHNSNNFYSQHSNTAGYTYSAANNAKGWKDHTYTGQTVSHMHIDN